MSTSNKIRLIVCFTYGISLKIWEETGLLGREILLYKKMVSDGHDVTFLTFGDTTDERYSGELEGIKVVPVYKYMRWHRSKWLNFFQSFLVPIRLASVFRRATHIKTNQMYGAWIAVLASIIHQKQLIVRSGFEMMRNVVRDEPGRLLGFIKGLLAYSLELVAYWCADKVVITSKTDMAFIKKFFGVRASKLFLIRNFIDTDRFTRMDFVPQKPASILYIGRLDSRKNITNLIKAVGEAGVTLDMIGKGDEKKRLESLAEETGAKVSFLGRFENRKLPSIINQYPVFVLPSFYENNPKTILEAMACGSVVIGTRVPGIQELIEDKESGFLCATGPKDLLASVTAAFSLSEKQAKTMGDKARMFVVSECALHRIYPKEMNLYVSIS